MMKLSANDAAYIKVKQRLNAIDAHENRFDLKAKEYDLLKQAAQRECYKFSEERRHLERLAEAYEDEGADIILLKLQSGEA